MTDNSNRVIQFKSEIYALHDNKIYVYDPGKPYPLSLTMAGSPLGQLAMALHDPEEFANGWKVVGELPTGLVAENNELKITKDAYET